MQDPDRLPPPQIPLTSYNRTDLIYEYPVHKCSALASPPPPSHSSHNLQFTNLIYEALPHTNTKPRPPKAYTFYNFNRSNVCKALAYTHTHIHGPVPTNSSNISENLYTYTKLNNTHTHTRRDLPLPQPLFHLLSYRLLYEALPNTRMQSLGIPPIPLTSLTIIPF